MKRILAETQRLVLRSPCLSDLSRCAELLADYEVTKMLSRVPHPYDLEVGRSHLAAAAENWRMGTNAEQLVCHIDRHGQMIGSLSFKKLQEAPEIGYWLGRPYWGFGYMSEALEAGFRWFFQSTLHSKILAYAMTENNGSRYVLEKLGFEKTGTGTSWSLARDCAVADTNYMLTKDAFDQAQADKRDRT